MVDFGKELVMIESYRIPWLIWIQLLVFFLLLLLLYAFGVLSASDLTSDSSSSAPSSRFEPIPVITDSTRRVQPNQAGGSQSIKGEAAPGATGRVFRGEETIEGEGASSKDSSHSFHHPCHFIQLAKSAFLKCLGLDHGSERCRNSEPKRER